MVVYLLAYNPPMIREAWIWIWVWYKYDTGRPLHIARVNLERMTSERVDLYRNVPLLGQPILVGVIPFPVE